MTLRKIKDMEPKTHIEGSQKDREVCDIHRRTFSNENTI